MKVKEIMTRPVVHAGAGTPTADVAELLAKHRISAVPITDDNGTVVGLVSEYDLLAKSGKTAREIMSPGVISVNEETDVEDVRFLLIDRRIKRVPVMAGSELVGIVSRGDIVRLMALHWICQVCGEQARGDRPPDSCPKCGGPRDRFLQEPQHPGM
jgi:CBS domain-containing protein